MDEDPSDPRSHRVSLKVFNYCNAMVLVVVESESFQILRWFLFFFYKVKAFKYCNGCFVERRGIYCCREKLHLIELENSNFVQHLKLKPGVSGSGC